MERTCGRDFANTTIHNKMDNIEEHIVNAIKDIRRIRKRPDIESIFIYISNKNASNCTIFDIGKVLDDLNSKDKVENKPPKKGIDSPFVVSDQLWAEDEKKYETVNSESLKGRKRMYKLICEWKPPSQKMLKLLHRPTE